MAIVGIDLFAGAGGMSLGASLAGVDVRLAVELDPSAAATYHKNHSKTPLLIKDVRKLTRSDLPVTRATQTTVLFGGPPCQGFSCSNRRTWTKNNADNWLFESFLRIAKVWQPDWIVFENVPGIRELSKGFFFSRVISQIQESGYTVWTGLLNAADYGVPQERRRQFIVGCNDPDSLSGFGPTASTRRHTVADAIHDLPILGNGAFISWQPYRRTPDSQYARSMRIRRRASPNHLVTRNSEMVIRRYPFVPQGGNWRSIPARLMHNYTDRNRCHEGIYHRLNPRRASTVIGNFRKNMLIHPTQSRGLSVREAARIQSFPDWYEFVGSIGFQQQQVGNAVPPLLAEAVFKSVASAT